MLKKIYLLAGFLLFLTYHSLCQNITNYSFSSTSGTFTVLSGGTIPTGTGTTDEGVWNAIPIGFNFWYMGTRYTTVSASTNGWLTLGADISNATYTNSLSAGGSPRPVLAPLWDDLSIQSGNNASYQTTGTAGSRIFTLQFLYYKWNYVATGNTISLQVKLYEGSGKIEYVYRQETGAVSAASASIGISAAATGSGNFLSLNGTGASPVASATTETATLNSKPSTGRIYGFTPPVPNAPTTISFTGISTTGMTLNWADNSSNETGFVVYGSTDGTNYSFYSQTAANATSSVQTGLSGNITYYWKIYALTEGAFSTALTGNQVTACTPPAAPTITTPVNYCLNATASQLTATGTNLLWGGTSVGGSVGGSSTLTTPIYVDAPNTNNNRKTYFTTTGNNVTITTVDYYIPAWQSINGIVLAIFNNSGTLIATSSTTSTQSAGSSAVKITNTFNYTIATAGNYSIGIASGIGNIGSDNPSFPITETTGTINITGVSSVGYRCFNNIQFTTGSGSATAPTPVTTAIGTTNYVVTQTVGGCVSAQATIAVTVTSPNISQIPGSNLLANYTFSGNANDITGNNNGTLQNAPSLVADRFGISNKSYSMNGSSQYVSTTNAYVNPVNFTVSTWFKTSTTTGGMLIGFGVAQTGASWQYDRHIYMNDAGQLYFGVYTGAVVTVNSALAYNDNKWHLATASLSSTTGMALYVDGALVGSNGVTTTAENYTGYWRIGYDNMNGWTSQPTSHYFNGSLDDVLIYDRALIGSEINTLYVSPNGAGNNGPVCAGSSLTLSATTLGGAAYAWSGPNGYSATTQNPSITYSAAAAGVYTLQVTVAGCSVNAYTNVSATANDGQWTGNSSTDWANAANWCTGVVPGSATNVVIPASATRMPAISSSVDCNNLSIASGATLTLAAAGTLNLAGNLSNSGTLTNTGTINFNGTSGQQTFSGISSFYNLTVNNAAGVLMPGAIAIDNNLTIAAGILNANNFNISVKGNWTNNASVSGFTAGTGTVTFNGSGAQVIGGSFVTSFNSCTIANTAATVTLSNNASIAANLTISSGTFDLAAFTANRATAGGVLTVANNAILKIGGTNTFPVNYSTNTLVVASTVEYSGTNQTVANMSYGNLQFSSSAGSVVKTLPASPLTVIGNLGTAIGAGTAVAFTAGSSITVNGNVSIGAGTTFNGGSYTISAGGNWVNTGIFNGNTSTVILTGSGATVGGAGTQNFNHLTVAAALVNFQNSTINISGNLATTGAGSFVQATGGNLVMTGSGTSISGAGINIQNLSVSGTVSTTTPLDITGNLTVSGSFTSTTGTITLSGNSKTVSGAGAMSFGVLSVTGSISTTANFTISSSLAVAGSLSATAGTATFTGSATLSGRADLYNTQINGTSLQLSGSSTLGIAGALTISAGILNVTSSIPNTVNFNGTGAQNINAITYHHLSLSNGSNKSATAGITVNGNISIGTGTTFTGGAYTHTIYNDWINNGAFTAGAGTIQFMGNQNTNIIGATTFNELTVNNTTAAAAIILQDNIAAATVNMTQGTILTGSDTLTITNTRTGNGIILGHIIRSHAFTTGVAYAFEGPSNTITFASASGVSKVQVSVTLGSIIDFPFGGSVSRLYTVNVPAGSYNATLRLHYEDNELNGSNESTMGLWNYNGSAWVASGKTANSTSSNYVEQSGLTNITKRWTFSDNSNVVQWNGSVSSDWNTAANWTVLQGSASRPPAATDIVSLGTAAFTNQPTISSTVSVKNINFGSVQAVTLSLSGGGTLSSGDIQGVWTTAVTHTINAGSQNLTVNGDLLLSDGVSGHAINLAIGTGTITVAGTLNQSGGANIVFSGAGNLVIATDHVYTSGIFTAGSGTVIYNGTSNQVIGAVNYNNLVINKASSGAAINSAITVSGNLTVTNGEMDLYAMTTVAGNITISTGGTLHNHSTLHIGGNWANTGTYNFSNSGTRVIFDGSGTQTISATTFNNLEINKPVGTLAELTGDVTLKGNLVGTSGTLDIKSYFFNRDVVGGSATILNAGTLIIGADNAPTKFSNYYLDTNSTVIFNGTATQHLLLPGVVYGNLVFRNVGVKNLYTAIAVNGDLTIESGASFDGGSNTITLKGNWLNSGTFIPSTSTLVCTGTTKSISGNTIFNKATIVGSYAILNDVSFNGLLNITSTGSLTGGSSIHTTMHGDLINSGVLYTLGTTTFSGNVLQTLSLINAVQTVALTVYFNGSVSPVLNSTSAPQYGYLNINNTGGVNPSTGWTILYSLTIGSGASFNGGVSTHQLLGNLTNNGTITSSGMLNFIPATAATINMGSNFSSTGTVRFGGAGAMTLVGTPTSFNNIVIANTNVAGISPSSNWSIADKLTVNSGSVLNAQNYSHTVGGNIVNNGTINSGTSTFTLNGTGIQGIYSGSPFNNLVINKPAGSTTLSTNVTVNGSLNFVAGNIQTGSYSIVLPSSGTVTGAAQNTGWVNGKLQKYVGTGASAQTYEIGDAASYTPVSLAFSAVSSAGNLTAYTTAGDHPDINSSMINASESINRFWTLTNSGTVFTNYSATFNYAATDMDAGADTAMFGAALYNGSSWLVPVTTAAGATQLQASGISSDGDFAMGEICNFNTIISYPASPYCSNMGTATVTLTGNGGGTYSSTAGLVINSSTGTIDLTSSTPGSYLVTYTINATGGCPLYLTSAQVIVSAAPTASISYAASPYCSSAGTAHISFAGTSGGSYASTAGLSINSTSGDVDLGLSTAGTYTVTYSVAGAGSCSNFSTTADITITEQPFASGTYAGNPYCANSGIAFPTGSLAGAVGTLSSTAGLTIDPTTGVVDLSTSTPGTYTVTYTVPASGGCAVYTNNTIISIATPGSWTGAVSSDWNDSGNWLCGQVPGSSTNITIPAGLSIYPDVSGANAVQNLTIQNGGQLSVTGGTLSVSGTISNAGVFDASTGTVNFNGSTPQVIAANTFSNNSLMNLQINNNVTLAGQAAVTGTLTIGSSNVTLTTGDFLTLLSTAAGTARVAPLPVNGSGVATSYISGNVNVERYIPAKRAWRLLTSPLSNTGSIYNSWQNAGVYVPGKGMLITGPAPSVANGLDASQLNTVSMKSWNPATQAFLNIVNTKSGNLSGNASSAANIGYFAFVRGDRDPANTSAYNNNATTLTSSGKLQTGRQVLTASPNNGSYTIMGNPYASPVDFNSLQRTHLLKRFYAWDATINNYGAYVVLDDLDGDGNYSKSFPSSLQNKIIQSGQAFFVLTDTAGAASLSFDESSKSNTSTNAGFRPSGVVPSMEITLNLLETNNSTTAADASIAEFDNSYCSCVNIQDAVKFTNTHETFSFYRNGVSLAIERRPVIVTDDTLFLRMVQVTQRSYQLAIQSYNLDQPGLIAYLEDKFTGIVSPVSLSGATTINFSVTGNAASIDANRFRIVFKQTTVLPVTFVNISALVNGKDINVQWTVENQQNIKGYEVERSSDGATFYKATPQTIAWNGAAGGAYQWLDKNVAPGDHFYRVRSIDLDGKMTYSKTVKATMGKGIPAISVFPNPVTNRTITLQLTNHAAGKYSAVLFNAIGQEVFAQTFVHPGGNATKQLVLPGLIARGTYQLEITDQENNKTIITVMHE